MEIKKSCTPPPPPAPLQTAREFIFSMVTGTVFRRITNTSNADVYMRTTVGVVRLATGKTFAIDDFGHSSSSAFAVLPNAYLVTGEKE